ncbi:hypothetical protein BJ944DRAFT_259859 [Cunninghamella echinulata]|nr:hypothetical protein BJ944DRAFT_259859 [Cunninghamella echinulata]
MNQSDTSTPIITPVEEKLKILWHKELSKFLKAVGLNETSQSLDTEILVLSHYHQAQLPDALETLVGQLLLALEQHVNAKEKLLDTNINANTTNTSISNSNEHNNSNNNNDTTIKTTDGLLYSINKKRKYPSTSFDIINNVNENSDNDSDIENRERAKRMDPNQVQIRASNNEVQQRIDTYIQAKQQDIDTSNRAEFLSRSDPKGEDITCARADAREINRNIQMKFDIVNNEDGPIARSLVSNTTQSSSSTNTNNNNNNNIMNNHIIVDERLKNIESHLNVQFERNTNDPFTCMERIKILEDTLMDIERKYPKWAAVHFNQPNRSYPPPPSVTYVARSALSSSLPSSPIKNNSTSNS